MRTTATMLHVLLTKINIIFIVHTTNYPDFILDLYPYSFTTVGCLALDYSLCSQNSLDMVYTDRVDHDHRSSYGGGYYYNSDIQYPIFTPAFLTGAFS